MWLDRGARGARGRPRRRSPTSSRVSGSCPAPDLRPPTERAACTLAEAGAPQARCFCGFAALGGISATYSRDREIHEVAFERGERHAEGSVT